MILQKSACPPACAEIGSKNGSRNLISLFINRPFTPFRALAGAILTA
jgi:hypothetical protein